MSKVGSDRGLQIISGMGGVGTGHQLLQYKSQGLSNEVSRNHVQKMKKKKKSRLL